MDSRKNRRLGLFGKVYAIPHGFLQATGKVTKNGLSAAGNIAKKVVNTVDAAGMEVTRDADNAMNKIMRGRKSTRKNARKSSHKSTRKSTRRASRRS
jgi:hypothetical protein